MIERRQKKFKGYILELKLDKGNVLKIVVMNTSVWNIMLQVYKSRENTNLLLSVH